MSDDRIPRIDTPSLVGTSLRSINDDNTNELSAVSSRSLSRPPLKTLKSDLNVHEYTTVAELIDEGALITDAETNEILDDTGKVDVSRSTVIVVSDTDKDKEQEIKRDFAQNELFQLQDNTADVRYDEDTHKDFVVVDIPIKDSTDDDDVGSSFPTKEDISLEALIDSQIASISQFSTDLTKKVGKKPKSKKKKKKSKSDPPSESASKEESPSPESTTTTTIDSQLQGPTTVSKIETGDIAKEPPASNEEPEAVDVTLKAAGETEEISDECANKEDAKDNDTIDEVIHKLDDLKLKTEQLHETAVKSKEEVEPVAEPAAREQETKVSESTPGETIPTTAGTVAEKIEAAVTENAIQEPESKEINEEVSDVSDNVITDKAIIEPEVDTKEDSKEKPIEETVTKEKSTDDTLVEPVVEQTDALPVEEEHRESALEATHDGITEDANADTTEEATEEATEVAESTPFEEHEETAETPAFVEAEAVVENPDKTKDIEPEVELETEPKEISQGNVEPAAPAEQVESEDISEINDKGADDKTKEDSDKVIESLSIKSSVVPEVVEKDETDLKALPVEKNIKTGSEEETETKTETKASGESVIPTAGSSKANTADDAERLISELEAELGNVSLADTTVDEPSVEEAVSKEVEGDTTREKKSEEAELEDEVDEETVDAATKIDAEDINDDTEKQTPVEETAQSEAKSLEAEPVSKEVESAAKSPETAVEVEEEEEELHEPTKEEIIELLKDEPVYLYTSLAGGGFHMPQRTNKLATILTANRIPFTYRDLGTDEQARGVWRRYGKGRLLPGIVRGKDDIIGNWEEIEEANEDYRVRELIYETL